MAESGESDFPAFADHHSALLDKRLLTRFYRPVTLASPRARTGWVEPDLTPFPWQDTANAADSMQITLSRRGPDAAPADRELRA